MNKWFLHIVYILIGLNGISQGQVRAIYSADTIRIGEQFFLDLNLTGSFVDTSIVWPEFDDHITDQIEIIKKSPLNTKEVDSINHISVFSQRFLLTAFDKGIQMIPAFQIKTPDSTYQTAAHILMVNTVEVDTSKGIYDVKPIFEVDYSISEIITDWFYDYWYWLIIIVLIVVLIILILKFKNRPQVIVEAPKPKLPAHITALKILNHLLKDQAWENENKKEYYSTVTDTIRKYLEERFEILALEKTTVEIIKDLKYSDIISKDKFFLQEILQQADLVKFAKFKPDNSDGKIVLEKSVEFVQRTKKMIEETNIEDE